MNRLNKKIGLALAAVMAAGVLPGVAMAAPVASTVQVPPELQHQRDNVVGKMQQQAQKQAQGAMPTPQQPAQAEIENGQTPAETTQDEVHFTIRNFRLEALELYLNEDDLSAILEKSMGHDLTLTDLNRTVNEVTRYARMHGYPAAAAYVPAQESKDGVVLIKMIPGRFGAVHLDNRSKLKNSVAEGFLHGVKAGDIIQSKDLETLLYSISDVSGTKAVGVLSPGKEFGTSDLTVRIENGKGTNTVLYTENYGAKTSGRYRLGVQHSIYDVNGTGAKVNVGGLISNKNLHNYYVNYETLVGHGGTTLGFGVSRMDYDLGASLNRLNATGIATTYSIFGSRPLYHLTSRQMQFNYGYNYRNLHDDLNFEGAELDSAKHSNSVYAGLSGYWKRNNFLTNYDFKVTTGKMTPNSDYARASDEGHNHDAGHYTKAEINLSSVVGTGHRSDLLIKLAAQTANHNLDGSEELSLGGANGVRAYPQGEGSGDIGWMGTAEWRMYTDVPGLVPSIYFDAGHVKYSKDGVLQGTESGITLKGWGIGLAYSQPSDWFARLDYARRIGGDPNLSSEAKAKNRCWFLMGKIW